LISVQIDELRMKVDLLESLPPTWNAIWTEDDENAQYLRDCLQRRRREELIRTRRRAVRESRRGQGSSEGTQWSWM